MRCLLVLMVLAAALLPSLPAAEPAPDDGKKSPLLSLPGSRAFKSDPYLHAAANLQMLGEEKAIAVLTALATQETPKEGRRTILLCRMLFDRAKPVRESRPPRLGLPSFVGKIEAKDWRAEWRDWPRMPIDLVDGVPFLVVDGYLISGQEERSDQYLDYCIRNCEWTDEVFEPKTAEEKRKALAKLVASPRWKQPLSDEAKKVLASQIE